MIRITRQRLITPEEVAKDNGYRQVAEEFAYAPRFFRRHRWPPLASQVIPSLRRGLISAEFRA